MVIVLLIISVHDWQYGVGIADGCIDLLASLPHQLLLPLRGTLGGLLMIVQHDHPVDVESETEQDKPEDKGKEQSFVIVGKLLHLDG